MSSAAHGLATDSVSWLFGPFCCNCACNIGTLSDLHDYITPVWRCIWSEFVIFKGLNLISRQGQRSRATDDNQKPFINFDDNLQPKEMPQMPTTVCLWTKTAPALDSKAKCAPCTCICNLINLTTFYASTKKVPLFSRRNKRVKQTESQSAAKRDTNITNIKKTSNIKKWLR